MGQLHNLANLQTNRRRVVAGSAAFAAMPILGSAGTIVAQSEGTPAPVTGGVLRIGVQGDPTALDPHLTVLAAAGIVIELAY
ncbi:MAG: hypothetical protein H0T93_06170, partial [Chloroflexia bacterium]|nr:hypothetical protein [Chloroflexia bacterium]